MTAPSKAPVASPWVRWRGFLLQTGLPPLWLLVFLFAGAVGVEVLRVQAQMPPLGVAVCAFAIACAGAVIASHERGERLLLILPCLWIIGSAVLGVLALRQWYEASPQDKGFYPWIRDALIDGDWILQGLFGGGLWGGKGSAGLGYLLYIPMLAVPGVLVFAAIRKWSAAERRSWELPPAPATRFCTVLIAAYGWMGYGFLLSAITLLPLLLRSDSASERDAEKYVRTVMLAGAALFGLMLAVYAMSKFNSLSFDAEETFAVARHRTMENRFLFGWCVVQLLLLIPTLWGLRAARWLALGLSLLPAPVGLVTALLLSPGRLGEHWVLIKLSGFSALALAYLPLSRIRATSTPPSHAEPGGLAT
jgi:hypothetical protein